MQKKHTALEWLMSIRSALKELLLIVEAHQNHTKNNFAWAEVEYAKEVLAQPEQEDKTTYIGETQWMQVPEPLSRIEIIKLWRRDFDKWSCLEIDYDQFYEVVKEVEKAHGIKIGVDDET